MTVDAIQDGRVCRIVLADPARHNALDMAMARELGAAVDSIGPDVGCVLLVAEGTNFCVGGDVGAFASAPEPGPFVQALADTLHRAILGLAHLAVPVVAAVQGWAAGAGMSLACGADVVLIEAGTRFRPAYAGIGLSPDGGMSYYLPRRVGVGRALDLLVTNRVVEADEAVRIGLASRIVADLGDAAEIAAEIADGPTAALGAARRLVRDGSPDLATQLAAEAAAISAAAAGPEGRAGVAAFVARQPPVWRPRV